MVRNRFFGAFIYVILFSLISNTSPAFAIYGGTPAIGNKVVVALLRGELATNSGCSGGLVAPRIVMTAAHCLTSPANDFWIAEPGSDLRNLTSKRIQAEQVLIPEGFSTASFPYQNDFGILVLKSGFTNYQTLEIATSEQIQKWMAEEASVTHVGYGCTELVDSPPCGATSPTPNQIETFFNKKTPPQFSELIPNTFSMTKISIEKTICGGDSGSPLLKIVDGKWVYVGAQSSSNGAGCTKSCNEICAATQGLPSVNQGMVQAALKLVAAASPTPTASSTPTVAASANPSSTPKASSNPTPSSKPSVASTPKPSAKTSTITCIKGKFSKKVTAINPKCPNGYKKK